MLRMLILSLFMLILSVPSAFPLDTVPHRQLIVSITDSWGDSRATLFRFGFNNRQWTLVGKGVPAVVGERGLAWDPAVPSRDPGEPVKKEGDRRAPAGMFPLTLVMGTAAAPPSGVTLPFRSIETGTHCVDDAGSGYYNRIVDEKELPAPAAELWKSSERMWEMPDLYRLLVVVDYNVRDPQPGNGSCIFMHIRRDTGMPTAGCTALAEDDLAELAAWLRPEATPALVQLPLEVYRQVWREWRLPSPSLLVGAEQPSEAPLADVRSLVPDVAVEMRYATGNNFTGSAVYDCGRCFLLRETAEKLTGVQRELKKKGLSLKLWDCYRPLSVQRLFWSRVPDTRYVADPRTGSRHNTGSAVDVTLVDESGRELPMPTPFDDFSPRAAHSYSDLPAKAKENRRLLREAMEKGGFTAISSEWWHYEDRTAEGALLDVPFGELCR